MGEQIQYLPLLDRCFEASSIKAQVLMIDSLCQCWAGTLYSDMKMQLAGALQIPHQANHNYHFHFSVLFISEAGVTIKTIGLAISVLKIIKHFSLPKIPVLCVMIQACKLKLQCLDIDGEQCNVARVIELCLSECLFASFAECSQTLVTISA